MPFRYLFILFLRLIAIHSFVVGLALIIIPPVYLDYFGYEGYQGRFFLVQGGIFHIIMAVLYLVTAKTEGRVKELVNMILTAKGSATVFLLVYFVFMEPILVIALSGVGDGLMFILTLWLYKKSGLKEESK